MNARERLQYLLTNPEYYRVVIEKEGSTRYQGLEDCKFLRAIDALLADFTIYAQEYAPVRLSLLLERAKALGYSPEDK